MYISQFITRLFWCAACSQHVCCRHNRNPVFLLMSCLLKLLCWGKIICCWEWGFDSHLKSSFISLMDQNLPVFCYNMLQMHYVVIVDFLSLNDNAFVWYSCEVPYNWAITVTVLYHVCISGRYQPLIYTASLIKWHQFLIFHSLFSPLFVSLSFPHFPLPAHLQLAIQIYLTECSSCLYFVALRLCLCWHDCCSSSECACSWSLLGS